MSSLNVPATNMCNTEKAGKEKTLNKMRELSKCRCTLPDRNFIQNFSVRLFHQYGLFVGRHPYYFLIIPFIITAALSAGILSMKLEYSMPKLFTPSSSDSVREYQVFLDFFNDDGGLFYFLIAATPKDSGSLSRPEYSRDVLEMYRYFYYNYTVTVKGKNYSFSDLQINHNDENMLAMLILEHFNNSMQLPIQYTYPLLKINGESYFIGNIIKNVTVDNSSKTIVNFSSVQFLFNSAKGSVEHANLLAAWAESFLKTKAFDKFPNLHLYYWNNELYTIEILRNAVTAMPFVVLGFCLLLIFAFVVSLSKDWTKIKTWESVASIVCVLLSTGSAFGIIFLVGYPYVGTLTVTPILVLALGMDVTYITLRSFQSTDPSLPSEVRLAETLSDSGPSIVITTLTNVLSAGIGCITNIWGVYIFSLANSIAVMILFFLQLTIFAAMIEIGARREAAKRNGILFCLPVKTNPASEKKKESEHYRNEDWWCKFSKRLAKILCTNYCRAVVCVVVAVYWGTSIYGCCRMKLGLTPEKFLLPDSPLLDVMKLDQDVMSEKVGILLYVFVGTPPNFTDLNETAQFNKMVRDFEMLPNSFGPEYTELWLRSMDAEYSSFLDDDDGNDTFLDSYQKIANFMQLSSARKWQNYMIYHINNGTIRIDRFLFTVIYKYTRDWDLRTDYTDRWRDVADNYDKFNVSIWSSDFFNFYTDQLESLPSNAIQDFIITGVCMFVVCILYIPNLFNTMCSLITVFSICVGAFGYLSFWDVSLDPISLTSFLLAIGYSVDFTSHISYHYYSGDGETQETKLYTALASIGLPMIETGASTILSVGVLCFVPSYVESIFFKSILLIVLIGLTHGLIILPTFLAWIPLKCLPTLFRKRDKSAVNGNVVVVSDFQLQPPNGCAQS